MFIRTLIAALLLSTALTGTVSASANADANKPGYWGDNCTKTEFNGEVMSYNAPAGATKVIVKGGTGNKVYSTAPFTNLTAPVNPNNNKPYAISHVIVCTDAVAAKPVVQTASAQTVNPVAAVSAPASLPNVGSSVGNVLAAGTAAAVLGYLVHRRASVRQTA
jgi:hypothetical protein